MFQLILIVIGCGAVSVGLFAYLISPDNPSVNNNIETGIGAWRLRKLKKLHDIK